MIDFFGLIRLFSIISIGNGFSIGPPIGGSSNCVIAVAKLLWRRFYVQKGARERWRSRSSDVAPVCIVTGRRAGQWTLTQSNEQFLWFLGARNTSCVRTKCVGCVIITSGRIQISWQLPEPTAWYGHGQGMWRGCEILQEAGGKEERKTA